MDTCREFDICWLRGSDYAEVTAPNSTALKNKIMKMAAKNEPGVKVMCINPDGSIVAHVPVKFVKVSKPRKGRVSQEAAQALADYRAKQAAEKAETVDDLPFTDLDEDEDEDWEDEPDEFS